MSRKKRFAIVDMRYTWEEAKNYCKRAGGFLAEAGDSAALQKIVDLIANDFPDGGKVSNIY